MPECDHHAVPPEHTTRLHVVAWATGPLRYGPDRDTGHSEQDWHIRAVELCWSLFQLPQTWCVEQYQQTSLTMVTFLM